MFTKHGDGKIITVIRPVTDSPDSDPVISDEIESLAHEQLELVKAPQRFAMPRVINPKTEK